MCVAQCCEADRHYYRAILAQTAEQRTRGRGLFADSRPTTRLSRDSNGKLNFRALLHYFFFFFVKCFSIVFNKECVQRILLHIADFIQEHSALGTMKWYVDYHLGIVTFGLFFFVWFYSNLSGRKWILGRKNCVSIFLKRIIGNDILVSADFCFPEKAGAASSFIVAIVEREKKFNVYCILFFTLCFSRILPRRLHFWCTYRINRC